MADRPSHRIKPNTQTLIARIEILSLWALLANWIAETNSEVSPYVLRLERKALLDKIPAVKKNEQEQTVTFVAYWIAIKLN